MVWATFFFVSFLLFAVDSFNPSGDILEFGRFLSLFMGTLVCIFKFAFLFYKGTALRGIIDRIKEKSIAWRRQEEFDEEINRICKRYFRQHMICVQSAYIFDISNVTILLIDSMFPVPKKMILGVFNGDLGSPEYYALNVLQYFSSIFVDCSYISTDLLVGGIYRDIIKELEIVNYLMQKLSTGGMSCAEKYKRVIDIAIRYQELRELFEDLGNLLTWFLGSYVVCVFSMMLCVCIEFSIVINENASHCLEPLYFFFFININFFCWCWLGHCMLERVSCHN